jgi:U4/U6 small nuclear ribonucleoprotein PRP3
MKKYKKLMLRRIKWAEDPSGVKTGDADDDDDDDSDSDSDDDRPAAAAPKAAMAAAGVLGNGPNRCDLVWEGTVKEPLFRQFRLQPCALEDEARDYLKRFRVEHYWDAVKNFVDKDV